MFLFFSIFITVTTFLLYAEVSFLSKKKHLSVESCPLKLLSLLVGFS